MTENVYDSPTGRILLVPQGTRLIGQYDNGVGFGHPSAHLVPAKTRAFVDWLAGKMAEAPWSENFMRGHFSELVPNQRAPAPRQATPPFPSHRQWP
ncbi:hypothetical protein ABID62_006972 [Bradyrhizobium sp. S3.9.1]